MLATFTLALAIAQTPPPAAAEAKAPPRHLALLIGIDDYASGQEETAPTPLRGAKSDVERARRILIDRFKFEDADIQVLFDKRATHEAIVRAIHDGLIERAGPETEVLLWFSGHGSRCPDAHPELSLEPGGLDSTLLAYDSRSGEEEGGFDVTDDEIYSLLRVLCTKTVRVTFVADACHSGGVTRGTAGAAIRYATDLANPLDWKRVEPFWPKDVPFLDDDRPERIERLRCVLLAACTHDEGAHEYVQHASGRTLTEGAFSHVLLEELDRLQPSTTYEQLIRRVGLRLGSLYRDQQPVAEGEIDRLVFSNRFDPPPAGFPAVVSPGSWPVRIEAGALHLLRTGSTFRITDLLGKELGRARVSRTDPVSAEAEWIGTPPRVTEPTAARAIELERPRGLDPIRMSVDDGDDLVESVAATLTKRGEPAIEVVRGTSQDVALSLQRRKDGPVRLVTAPEGVELWSSSAPQDPADASKLSAILADEERFRGLLALAQLPGPIPVSVDVREVDASDESRLPKGHRAARLLPAARASSFTGSGARKEVCGTRRVQVDRDGKNGDGKNVLNLFVRVGGAVDGKPVFISVLCVSEDRSISLLHPSPGARDNEVAPGAELRVPIAVFETPEVPGLRRVPIDRILVIATDRFTDFSPLVRDGRLRRAAELRTVARGGEEMPDLLSDLLMPLVTRGSTPTANTRGSFGVAALDLEVVSAACSEGAVRK
jgi:hypothetical protein